MSARPRCRRAAWLSAYAQFFATERSLEAGEPHLVPLEELSPAEDQARNELERELFKFRDHDARGFSPVHQFWHFEDEAPITVICSDLRKSDQIELGPLSDEDNPNHGELYSYGDLDALFELNGHLRSVKPNTVPQLRREATPDLINHLVVLGGIAWNDATRRLNNMLKLPVKQVSNEKIHSGEVFEIVGGGPNHGEQFLPHWLEEDPGTAEEPGVLLEDVGMLARLPNPYNELRTLTYCNGIHSRGVLGAVRCLTDPDVRDDKPTIPGGNVSRLRPIRHLDAGASFRWTDHNSVPEKSGYRIVPAAGRATRELK